MFTFFAQRQYRTWAYGGAALIILGLLANTYLTVMLTEWREQFWDGIQAAIGAKSATGARERVFELLGLLGSFGLIAGSLTGLSVANAYFTSVWCFNWRKAMAQGYEDRWDSISGVEGISQRVQYDTKRATELAEKVGVTVIQAIMTLIAFVPMLVGMSVSAGALPVIGVTSWGLPALAVIWSMLGTLWMIVAGFGLAGLTVSNERIEASYRKQLVLAEHASLSIGDSWAQLSANYARMFARNALFDMQKYTYLQMDVIVIYVILLPSIASGSITLGALMAISSAFGQVTQGLQVLVNARKDVIDLQAAVIRLRGLDRI